MTKKDQEVAIKKSVSDEVLLSANEPKAIKSPAKAGKRSTKSMDEAEAKKAKLERKASNETSTKLATKKPNIPRTKLERAGKKYREAAKRIDSSRSYTIAEAVDIALKASSANFDETLEIHINLNIDPKQADQNVRGTVVLPSGTGKSLRIAVLADSEGSKQAKQAGADMSDGEALLKSLEKEAIEFDVLIATPANMPMLGKFAKLLGPKGLMPNPKSGTVTNDVAIAIKDAKAGKVEFRVDSYGIIHMPVGKKSFGTDKLVANSETVIAQIRSSRPTSVKGVYMRSIVISTTMGPSVRVIV